MAKVDITTEDGKKLSDAFGIVGVPTLYYFPTSSNQYYKYNGSERNAAGLDTFVNQNGWKSAYHRSTPTPPMSTKAPDAAVELINFFKSTFLQ